MLMLPWLILGWLHVVLAFTAFGISVLALCFVPEARLILDNNMRMIFHMFLAAASYTGEYIFLFSFIVQKSN
jgi:hypothetical protein